MARSTFLISTLGLLGLGACVDNGDGVVVILQNQVATGSGGACNVAGSPGDDYQATGLIEGNSPQGYVFTPVLKNYSVSDGTNDQQIIAQIHGATVDVHFADRTLFDSATISQFRTDGLTHFRVPYTGRIEPGGTTSMIFEIVPADLLAEIAAVLPDNDPTEHALLFVDVSVDGALGPTAFETKAFQFPIEVCNGCLAVSVGACSLLSSSYTPELTGGACNPFQDEPVECCLDGNTAVCPADPAGAPAQ